MASIEVKGSKIIATGVKDKKKVIHDVRAAVRSSGRTVRWRVSYWTVVGDTITFQLERS